MTQKNDQLTSDRIDILISQMSLAEKIGQMNQYSGFFDVTGPAPANGDNKVKYENIKKGLVGSMLNVRGVEQVCALQKLAVANSPSGIPLIFGLDVIHGHKTQSPIPLAESASWDIEAIERSARIGAIEASAEGVNWTFAPMVDISRDARWGRVMEGAGEDPFLGSAIARARIKGFHGENLNDANSIATCAKHFAAYGFAEAGKDYNTSDVGLSTLYNIVLPPFRAALDAGVQTFMNSFSELNGVPAAANEFLLRDLLKEDWGFEGFVVSDWGSIFEMVAHGYAEDGSHAAELSVNAGMDMDMESHVYAQHLEALVESGKVDMKNIDDAVRRILKVKENLGLLDDPYKYCDLEREKSLLYHPDHMEAALDMAKKSIVLLKNEGDLLPLSRKGKNIALIGELADDKNSPLGNWRLASDDNTAVSVKQGLDAYLGDALTYEHGVKIYGNEQHFVRELAVNTTDDRGIDAAVELAKASDLVIMVLGEHGYLSGEGRSRSDIGLPGLQQRMLEEVFAVNQNIVLVLMNGRPLAIPWCDEHIPAIVEAWQLGTRSGDAIAQVLFGDYNPSGKLPMTFPRDVGQIPIYYNYKNTGRPGPRNEVFYSHYIDQTNEPLYVFGHGLSYTTFKYSNLVIEPDEVRVTVKNSGDRDGEEVVQLYIRDMVASVTRPVKELKGFDKVLIKAGESKIIRFRIDDELLGFYNNQGEFVVEPGKFMIMIGGSSNTSLSGAYQLEHSNHKK